MPSLGKTASELNQTVGHPAGAAENSVVWRKTSTCLVASSVRCNVPSVKTRETYGKERAGKNWVFPHTGRWKTGSAFLDTVSKKIHKKLATDGKGQVGAFH